VITADWPVFRKDKAVALKPGSGSGASPATPAHCGPCAGGAPHRGMPTPMDSRPRPLVHERWSPPAPSTRPSRLASEDRLLCSTPPDPPGKPKGGGATPPAANNLLGQLTYRVDLRPARRRRPLEQRDVGWITGPQLHVYGRSPPAATTVDVRRAPTGHRNRCVPGR